MHWTNARSDAALFVILLTTTQKQNFKDKYTVKNAFLHNTQASDKVTFHFHRADIHSCVALFMCQHTSLMYTFALWIVLCEAQYLATEVQFWSSCAFPFFVMFYDANCVEKLKEYFYI